MLLDQWGIALGILGSLTVLAALIAGRTAWGILCHFDPEKDSEAQIRLENEIPLSSTLMAYGLGFQILSLAAFVAAAESFSAVLKGAMCATGTLNASPFGPAALAVKILSVFAAGIWLLLHHLDCAAPSMPLVRMKYRFLLAIIPLVLLDFALQTAFLATIHPDVVTSCCSVVFDNADGMARLFLPASDGSVLFLQYPATAVLILLLSAFLWRPGAGLARAVGILWLVFFALSLVAITTVFSSYVYAMPFHHCPFCILKPEYHAIGAFWYLLLFSATFAGLVPAIAGIFATKEGLATAVARCQRYAAIISLVCLLFFALLSSFPMLLYLLSGGET